MSPTYEWMNELRMRNRAHFLLSELCGVYARCRWNFFILSFCFSLPFSVRSNIYNGILYVRASGPEAARFSLSFCYCCCCRHRYWCCFSSLLLLTAAGFLSLLYVITTSFYIAIVHLFYMHCSTIWLLCVFIMLPFASLALPSNAF